MKRLLSTLAIITVTLGLTAVAGCSSLGGTVKPNPTVEDKQAVIDQAAVLASATKSAAKLANQARDNAQALYDSKVISASVMQKINNAGIVASRKGLEFVDFAETVTTDASLRTTASALLDVFKEFIDSLSGTGVSGDAIRAALSAFFAYLGVK